jgi:hypothetical protein
MILTPVLNIVRVALLSLCITGVSIAQQSPTQRPNADTHAPVGYSGILLSSKDMEVSLKDKDGKTITVEMTSAWTVVIPHSLDVSALEVGAFIASSNVNLDENRGKSIEVRIMEPGYKPEEGTHPMGQPNTSMTHGAIESVTHVPDGVDVDVVYSGGSRHLLVPQGTKVTGYEVHPGSYAKPGMNVTAVTRKGADGVSRAARLILTQ